MMAGIRNLAGIVTILTIFLSACSPPPGRSDVIRTPIPPPATAIPQLCASSSDSVQVSFTVDSLWVKNPEEADTTSIIKGDEAILLYGLAVASGSDLDFGTNNRYAGKWESDGDAYEGDRFSSFSSFTRTLSCGQTVYAVMVLSEDDAPFGGETTLGEPVSIAINLARGVASNFASNKELSFSGSDHDGSYDYRLYYSIRISRA